MHSHLANSNNAPALSAAPAGSIQKKLAIGAVNDPLEAEADAMADKVMRMPDPGFIQRKCHCEEEEKLHRKPIGSLLQRKADESAASESVTQRIGASRGGGQVLGAPERTFMESRFGTDF